MTYGVMATYALSDYSEGEKIIMSLERLPSRYVIRLKQFYEDTSLKSCVTLTLKMWVDLLSYEDIIDDALRSVQHRDKGVNLCLGLGARTSVNVMSPCLEVLLRQYSLDGLGPLKTSLSEGIRFKLSDWKTLLSEGDYLVDKLGIGLDAFRPTCDNSHNSYSDTVDLQPAHLETLI